MVQFASTVPVQRMEFCTAQLSASQRHLCCSMEQAQAAAHLCIVEPVGQLAASKAHERVRNGVQHRAAHEGGDERQQRGSEDVLGPCTEGN